MKPMLATPGTVDLLDRQDYYFEAKLDGYRALCFKKTRLKFTSRNGIIITHKYPEFDFFDDLEAEECILDGEIVVYNENGIPSFELLRNREENGLTATYVAFDILYLNGNPLLSSPLYARKKILDKVVKESEHLQVSFYTKKGRELWNTAKKKSLEGVMAKKDDSSYELGERSDSWRKIKLSHDIDCVILGYTQEKRSLTSLALGLYDGDRLVFSGKVGTGFDEKTMAELKSKLDEIKVDKPIVETEEGVIPVMPVLVALVNYFEVTKAGKLRAPVFIRLREDKDPLECVVPSDE